MFFRLNLLPLKLVVFIFDRVVHYVLQHGTCTVVGFFLILNYLLYLSFQWSPMIFTEYFSSFYCQ